MIQQQCYICHNSAYDEKRLRCCHSNEIVVHQTVAENFLSNNSVRFVVIARMIGRDLDVDCHPCVVY